MRIAIIGSGISGLTAAYLAVPHSEVTVYESANRLGGHADTHTVTFGERQIAVDTGFMVFNPERYPNFVRLLSELGIGTTRTSMTFSVSIPGSIEYKSTVPTGMFFGAHVFNPRFYVFVYDILRFNRKAKRTLRSGQALYTLGSFLDEGGFSREFKEWYLYPMLGSIWSTSSKDLVSFSTLDTFRFLNGHKLLNVIFGSRWSTIPGGSRRYVDAVSKHISQHGARIFLGTPVLSVARNKESVTVHTKTGSETFDHVIFATHADTALSLIEEPSDAEREILGTFRYSVNDIVLHSDAAAMPTRRSAWASWNYTARTGDPHDARISLTYNMNALQHIDPAYPIYVTLNGTRPIKEALVHERFSYTHPQFSIATTKAQSRLAEIQGKHRTLFAGAHWGFGFHEDGVASGIEAVKSLGIAVPWSI